jgi:hypothetical protein
VDTTVGFARDCRSDSIHDTHTKGTTLDTVAHSQNRIRSLTRLRHKNADIVTEDRGFPVKEVRRELDGDWDLGQFLEDRASLNRNQLINAELNNGQKQLTAKHEW